MKVIREEGGIPIKMWLDEVEPEALNQALNLSKLPFAFHHVAIMADSHSGYGMPIGGVLVTKNVVIVNAVGVDIGCGMCACPLGISKGMVDRETLSKIMHTIRCTVPVGFNKHSQSQFDESILPSQFHNSHNMNLRYDMGNAMLSLGTLGGGNHFIEIQEDEAGMLWAMVHSGSRNIGKIVAERHNSIAKALNSLYYSLVPASYDLAFLPLNSQEGMNYLEEMNGCVEYALLNRSIIMDRVIDAFGEVISCINRGKTINIHHNYAAIENHYGEDVVIHRKGATSAKLDEYGIIPGSQGTCSYIVKGLGNPESFMSCSHGAGRILSRSKAKKVLDLAAERARLDEKGIIHNMNSVDKLDEAPGAYKDIDEVMYNQRDLVSIFARLNPLAVIKG